MNKHSAHITYKSSEVAINVILDVELEDSNSKFKMWSFDLVSKMISLRPP